MMTNTELVLELMRHSEASIFDALVKVAKVIREHRHLGGRWRKLSVAAHLWHALVHIVKHLCLHAIGACSRTDLEHAATRTLLALQIFSESEKF